MNRAQSAAKDRNHQELVDSVPLRPCHAFLCVCWESFSLQRSSLPELSCCILRKIGLAIGTDLLKLLQSEAPCNLSRALWRITFQMNPTIYDKNQSHRRPVTPRPRGAVPSGNRPFFKLKRAP